MWENTVKIYRYVSFEFWAKLVKDSKFATFKQSSLSCLSVRHFSVLAAEKWFPLVSSKSTNLVFLWLVSLRTALWRMFLLSWFGIVENSLSYFLLFDNLIEETYPPLLLYIVDKKCFHKDEIRFLRYSYHHLKWLSRQPCHTWCQCTRSW